MRFFHPLGFARVSHEAFLMIVDWNRILPSGILDPCIQTQGSCRFFRESQFIDSRMNGIESRARRALR